MQAERLSAYKAAPAAMRAVQQVEAYIQQCGLEKSLIELVKMRDLVARISWAGGLGRVA